MPTPTQEARDIVTDMVIEWLEEQREDVAEVATPLDHLSIEEGQGAIDWMLRRLGHSAKDDDPAG